MELFRLNNDATVALDPLVQYYTMDSCPWGVKVQLWTEGGVHTTGTVHPGNVNDYKGWRGIPTGPAIKGTP